MTINNWTAFLESADGSSNNFTLPMAIKMMNLYMYSVVDKSNEILNDNYIRNTIGSFVDFDANFFERQKGYKNFLDYLNSLEDPSKWNRPESPGLDWHKAKFWEFYRACEFKLGKYPEFDDIEDRLMNFIDSNFELSYEMSDPVDATSWPHWESTYFENLEEEHRRGGGKWKNPFSDFKIILEKKESPLTEFENLLSKLFLSLKRLSNLDKVKESSLKKIQAYKNDSYTYSLEIEIQLSIPD